jgi:hypothetical protein
MFSSALSEFRERPSQDFSAPRIHLRKNECNICTCTYRLLLHATCDEGEVALVARCDSQRGAEDDAGALAKPYALTQP